jgi:choline dehydrogenase-like flavoprotein
MPNRDQFDVIIIGTGAGGGTLAYRLAPSGKRILLLERGDFLPREKDNWQPRAVNVDGKYQTKEVWKDRNGKDLHPHTNYCVGGNTKTSALDVNCRTHDVDNLYVVDSSFFPSSGAVNPGLTIMANALGVGEDSASGVRRNGDRCLTIGSQGRILSKRNRDLKRRPAERYGGAGAPV